MLTRTRIEVRDLRPADWPEVAAIYEAGMLGRDATFETEVPTWETWDAAHLPGHRLVAFEEEGVVGWAALAPVSSRGCYRGVVEDSVYVAPGIWRDTVLLERRTAPDEVPNGGANSQGPGPGLETWPE